MLDGLVFSAGLVQGASQASMRGHKRGLEAKRRAEPLRGLGRAPEQGQANGVVELGVERIGPLGHGGSRKALLGDPAPPELVELLSNEKHVTERTPPCFLVHSTTDRVVPVEHSRLFVAALKAKGVPSEYLELTEGDHGLGVGKGPLWERWQAACLAWMDGRGLLAPR